MNAMILAAGKGERMRPLTLTTPKPLLPAAGKPLIGYHLERLAAAGFRKAVINHAWLGEQLEQALGSGASYGIPIVYSAETTPLETAGGIQQALPLLCAPDHTASGDRGWFVVINGDIWCDFDLRQLLTPPPAPATAADTRALLVLTDNPCHNPEGDFFLSACGRVGATGQPRLTFTGISLLHASLFDGLEPGHQPLAPLLRAAMQRGQVKGMHHRGHWMDIGTPQRLEALDQLLRGVQGEHHGTTTA
ncbi:N-acetylmuramate alpha-1-phosphate uridylyltransferase MurU [Marinobacter sp. X15-166B]|uniref:N-acetylmuramate alpha-1-phosphate uridylyltransferase MurU n=1 Tax=Marinobacter sp. X15-166B TaxID=1897620 RepID=UPI00085C02C0|nr:nucleotidyltransferase family protein [Marinobacter sp. X15-166B]OEY65718.1 mannose-1-phosphate guanylyltransferase [Marinobacter sp. X15-166B]